MENNSGDFALSISSDMIAEVMEKYFNTFMFKRKVRVVDLKPSPDGYIFVVEYLKPQVVSENPPEGVKLSYDVYESSGVGMNGEIPPPVKVAEEVTLPWTPDTPQHTSPSPVDIELENILQQKNLAIQLASMLKGDE